MSNSTDQSEADQFTEALKALDGEVRRTIQRLADELVTNSAQLLKAADEINPTAIARTAAQRISELEQIVEEDFANLDFPPGWLVDSMESDLLELEASFHDLKNAAQHYGKFLREHEGVGGFVARAIKGAMNPLDGLLHFVGKGSVQNEEKELVDALSNGFAAATQCLDTLRKGIELQSVRTAKRIAAQRRKSFGWTTWALIAIAAYVAMRLLGVL